MHISLYLHDSADKTMDALRCRRLGVAPCCSAGCTMCRPWLPGYITGYNGVTVDPHLLPIITILTSALLHTFKQHYRRPPRSPFLFELLHLWNPRESFAPVVRGANKFTVFRYLQPVDWARWSATIATTCKYHPAW